MNETRTLEVQRSEFSRRRFLAMPLGGMIAWSIVILERRWRTLPG